jgi:hypothetical protein
MQDQIFSSAENNAELTNGLNILELEERLETAQMAAELAADSDRCDIGEVSVL